MHAPAGERSFGGGRLPSALRRPLVLNPFSVFVVIYVTAFLLEMVEHWTYPWVTAAFLALSVGLFARLNRATFLGFLVLATAYFVIWRFPENANHVNLIIFSNIAIIVALLYSFTPASGIRSDDEFYELVQPILRLLIIITFSVAGFHKLNYDFLNPAVSCVAALSWQIRNATTSSFFDFAYATTLIIGAVGLFAALLLWRGRREFRIPPIDWVAIAAPLLVTAAATAVLLTQIDSSTIDTPRNAIIFVLAIAVLCWQLVECLLLLIPRFQWVALCFSLLIHAQLAMIRLVDFQSIALALLIAFIPPAVWKSWLAQANVRIGKVYIHRAYAYLLLNMLSGLFAFINYQIAPVIPNRWTLAGLLFNAGVLILLWPIILDLFSKNRPWRWTGVRVFNPQTPRFWYVVPVALLAFGFTSHLGLRTAGNFSMFSNLKTEGPTSNHILFGSNPIKIFGYQEDVVRVIEFDNRDTVGYNYQPLNGMSLPVVEFRRRILVWREMGRAVPMTYEYAGRTITTRDVVNDPLWRGVRGVDWEMKLFDFRVIQPGRPNQCRW